jgi:DNA segregation ATPase FtsK/SpoIIIE-like protein
MVKKKLTVGKKKDKEKDKDEDFDCKKAIKSIKVNGLKTLKKTQSVLNSIATPTEQIRSVLDGIGIMLPERLTIAEYAIYMNVAKCMQSGDMKSLMMLFDACGISVPSQINFLSKEMENEETKEDSVKMPTLNSIEKEAYKMLLYNDNNKKEKNG